MGIAREILQLVLLPPLLVLGIGLWVAQLVSFSPFLLIGVFLGRRGRPADVGEKPALKDMCDDPILFNRVGDISKIYGCNTRNVGYRWSIFRDAIEDLRSRSTQGDVLRALDFGAGSLRDTYELASLGFEVKAVDSNLDNLELYHRCYDWEAVPVPPVLCGGSSAELEKTERFDLITAFDVLEHLHDLEDHLSALRDRLSPDGIFLATVPNRRSLFESVHRWRHQRRLRKNVPIDTSGVPHVQFKTPDEWRQCFTENGFRVLKHDMTIGFLVNDCWHGVYGLAVRASIEPAIKRIVRALNVAYTPGSFEKLFYPAWLMKRVHVVDELVKPMCKHRWGWNLFVVSPEISPPAKA